MRWSSTDRRLARLGVGVVGVLAGSGAASAHGGLESGGPPVSFALVLWLPVVTGLLGGGVAVVALSSERGGPGRSLVGRAIGPLLLVLGVTAIVTTLVEHPLLGLAVGGAGAAITHRFAGRDGGHGHHADVALGGVCVHRFLEGAALGTLSLATVVVGWLGAAAFAGHAALETAAVGGLYAPNRMRAAASVVVVQGGYLAGALALSASAPPAIQPAAIALVGGVLLAVGVDETTHRPVALEPTSRPR